MKLRRFLEEPKSDIYYLSLIFLLFLGCVIIAAAIEPTTLFKFFSSVQLSGTLPDNPSYQYYWDVRHYATLALENTCSAFYPLWPWLIKTIFQPQNLDSFASAARLTATIIFLLTTVLLFKIFRLAFAERYIAFLSLLAYTINPNTIFRLNGYTESWFTLLSTISIWILLPNNKLSNLLKLVLLSVVTFLMGLSRSVTIQTAGAGIAALLTIAAFDTVTPFPLEDYRIKL